MKFEYADKYACRKGDIPTAPHWVIITFGSRPDSYDGKTQDPSIDNYEVYLTEEKWKDQISIREQGQYTRGNYVAAKVIPASINITVNVDVKENV